MDDPPDLVELTEALARIASQTADPATGLALMALIEQLLTAAGLPPDTQH